MTAPAFKDVEAAAKRIRGRVTRTSLLRSIELDRVTGGNIFVKPECQQMTGAFKLRGAFSRLTALDKAQRARGVVAFSSGNHGQAVAYAAGELGIAATIVMPEGTPRIKVEKTRSHGPKVVLFDPKKTTREEVAGAIAEETGPVLLPSSGQPFVIAGQGTHALEVIEDAPGLDAFLVCTGGGGLLAGTALVFAELSPKTKLYSVEPENYNDHQRSFAAGKRIKLENPKPTICDALLPLIPGGMTFEINKQLVTGGLAVSDDEVRTAMRFAFENLKLVAEPGGAVALAAVLAGKIETTGKIIGLIITGGNVDPAAFREILAG